MHFTEVAEQAGIRFTHHNGAHGKKYMPETVGSGVAFVDYDNDGWQDILVMNGTDWPENRTPASRNNTPHLYHNNHHGTFTDVTRASGLGVEIYGMGVAAADFDNDGYPDLYLTALGANRLFRNTLGDPNRRPEQPTFEDVTAKAGLAGVPMPGQKLSWKWSSSAAWLDYDKDGKLDLFVCQYVLWSPQHNKWCGHNGIQGYCPPQTYEPAYCTLYHNDGNGHFRDVSETMGIRGAHRLGKAFGIAVADYNGDGWPDIAVTNDTWANFLFINESGKHFSERGVESGIAYGENGHAKAGMGIDTADWKNDGSFGLVIGNFAEESLSLFENDGQLLFNNQAYDGGLGSPSLHFLTFGLFFFDYDLDGRPDIFTANGHVDDIVNSYNAMVTFRERPLLFHNRGTGRFAEVGEACGLTDKVVGRGAAYADIDNDGDLDIALVDNGGRFRLFRNDGGNRNHWIRFRLEGRRSNRDGIGVLIKVTSAGATQSQYVHSGGSFLSESQREPTFGLGSADTANHVEILWPSGVRDVGGPLPAGRQYLVTEGQGFHEDARYGQQPPR